MNLSTKIQEIQAFLNDDYSWLDKTPRAIKELHDRSDEFKVIKDKVSDYSPIIYSRINRDDGDSEMYDSFVNLHQRLIDYKKRVENSLSKRLTKVENTQNPNLPYLKEIIDTSRNLGDFENFYRAKKIHDEEARIRDEAIEDIDSEYIKLRKNFLDNNWGTKNISDLEKMLSDSDLLVEKGRFLNDTELVYHGSELSNRIVGVVNNLKTIKRRQIKTRIGISLGIALTTFSIIQHYIPAEPVQNATKNAYEWVKEKIEEIK